MYVIPEHEAYIIGNEARVCIPDRIDQRMACAGVHIQIGERIARLRIVLRFDKNINGERLWLADFVEDKKGVPMRGRS